MWPAITIAFTNFDFHGGKQISNKWLMFTFPVRLIPLVIG